MFIHLHVPAFHAAVHQAVDPGLRGQPVVVAVDAGEQAVLFDVSAEARAGRLWPGLRVAAARRRCPAVRIVTPRPDWYQRAQRALTTAAVAATPRVGGSAGHLDLDLGGTEAVWQRASGLVDAGAQAQWWAERLQARVRHGLRLPVCLGIAARPRIARLAALAARRARGGVQRVPPGDELTAIAAWPVRWLRELPEDALQALAACGIATFGALAALPPADVYRLLGAHARLPLAVLAGEDEPEVPVLDAPEREIAVAAEAGPAGADAAHAERLLTGLARDLGFRLRAEGSACTRLTLTGTWLDGRTALRACPLRQQLRHDDELARAARGLLAPLARRVAWERLGLAAGGLRPLEDQLELLAPPRGRRVQAARDQLRARFGAELVRAGW